MVQLEVRNERSFTLLDALVLVMSLAVGMAQARVYYATRSVGPAEMDYFTIGRLTYVAWAGILIPLLFPIGPALVVLRLRRTWRPSRRLTREPGLVAAIVTGVLGAVVFAVKLLIGILPGPPHTSPLFSLGILNAGTSSLSVSLGPAVFAVWTIQYLSGRWRPQATWIDRAGRALGIFWMTLYLAMDWLRHHL
jgi:hypothetical protein